MRLESAKYLQDVREAGRTVVEITAGRTLDDYLSDKILRLAVERCFEITGEALRRLDDLDHDTASKITNFKRIIGFRNILIHGYSLVQHELVWNFIESHLPVLLSEVEALLVVPLADTGRTGK